MKAEKFVYVVSREIKTKWKKYSYFNPFVM